uniref:Putative ribonuclease H-like domain-containing protein n=1 Tax=Tanacetum cinerariifolium TaxID=118510 RepID=A0A699HAY4_TANCI|nr:putative ribonuclease H-like domain-containing protein [Tanacetum cinerariifolium]
MSVRTKVGLGFTDCISQKELGWDDFAFNVFTTTSKDVEGRPTFHRFAKTDSVKVVPPPLTGDYTSLSDHTDLDESQMSYGTMSSTSCDPKYVPNDSVSCDDSDKSSEDNTNDLASSDSGLKSSAHKPTESSCASTSSVSTSMNGAEIDSNVGTSTKEPISVQDFPSFTCNSFDKNEHSSRTSCNKHGSFNKKAGHFKKYSLSVSKLCFVCDSGTHLINDCDFYEKQMTNTTVGPTVRPQPVPTGTPKVKPVSTCKPKATLVPTGRPRGTPVPTSKPKTMPVPTGKPKGTLVPTGKPTVHPVPTGIPKFTPVPTGWLHMPFPVATDRGCSLSVPSDWQLLLSPQQVVLGKHIEKDNTFSAAEDEGIFGSGCSRSMTGNKDRLDDFQAIHGGKVTFGGGEGRITRKGTIHTECLILSKDFKLPDDSMVVLKVPRKHNLYTINALCPRGNLACLVAHASFDECVKWHRRMAHVNYKNMNRCDNGTEFKNAHMIELYGSKRIKREYSNPKTLQQNRVAERKNKTLIEAARTMLADSKLHTMFWTEAVRTTCYVLNRVSVTSPHNKTHYALLTGNIPAVSHFKPFGCHVNILNTSDHLGKFDGKADEGYIVGYSVSNKAYRVYNVPNKQVEETMNLWFLEDKPNVQGLGHEWYFILDYLTDSLGYKHALANQSVGTQGNKPNYAGIQDADSNSDSDKQVIIVPSYPSHSIQGTQPIDTPGDKVDDSLFLTPVGVKAILPGYIPVPIGRVLVPAGSVPVPTSSITVPTDTILVLADDKIVPTDDVPVHSSNSTDSMFDGEPTTRFLCPSNLGNHDPSPSIFSSSSYNDEFDTALNNVESSMEVLVDLPPGKYVIRTKWILKNKRDAREIVVRNKARLVAQGHRQEEGIDYDEVFAPVARIEAIRLFLAFASYMRFLVYQMHVKSAFLYERIEDEAPRAWYATLSTFLLKHGYKRGTIDKTLFLNKNNHGIILVQVYVDDIIFGSTKKEWCDEFETLMKGEFQMSAMGELTFFLGLQVQQRPDGIFIHQDKYVQEILHKFDLGNVRTATTPYEAPKPMSKSESDSPVNVHLYRPMISSLMYLTASRPDIMFAESPLMLEAYSDIDYAGANKDRKSITGGCQFLGRQLISWQCKKQTIVATSSTEADLMIHNGGLVDIKCSKIDQVALIWKQLPAGYVVFPTG